jgi:hypothetical protein
VTASLLERHRVSGRVFTADGIGSFVLDEGPPDAEAVVSNAKLKRELDWTPRYPTIETGIPATVAAIGR